MTEKRQSIEDVALRLVASFGEAGARELDFSLESIASVEAIMDDMVSRYAAMHLGDKRNLSEAFGCYILEVARRQFGGRYLWHDAEAAPVLVVGEPDCSIALLTFPKAAGRLKGDEADNIPFFFDGFAERATALKPGDSILFV